MRIEADLELCISAGMCAMTAPDAFDQDPGDGRVILRVEEPEAGRLDAVREAVGLCPSGALSLNDPEKEKR
jgi:ferredoxin